ncbi:ankyrin repeat and KH domain-containing protein mask-like [Drosophila nasuta]|uniref:ankyrin repeat and KH domain-containing protein mask-like n=1 Tax=Drosophila nasuta TaxID=42062 RepID=UPI00295F48C9|nr:ankyrin repeat and KH domain-containing protein mask-like [Drosophila nasuta]
MTPLVAASVLFSYGANLEHKTEDNRTPLMEASRMERRIIHENPMNWTTDKRLRRHPALTGFQGRKDSTSLIKAAASGHCDIVIVLLRNNFNVNASCENGDTALMVASAGGYVNVVNALLSHGANVKEHNLIEHTPLMKAACAGHVEVAKVLLERGAGINTRSNVYNESALSVASYKVSLKDLHKGYLTTHYPWCVSTDF